ncbi:g522 [Coccomyxa viridis]|uniref:G522 protein n=1 Tax=Coccomyxa viridis TaxID=1274662 RepID=A0ABP1FFX5_9CHLO
MHGHKALPQDVFKIVNAGENLCRIPEWLNVMKGGATYRARKLGLESWKEAYTYTPEALETYLGKKVYTPKQFEYLNAYMDRREQYMNDFLVYLEACTQTEVWKGVGKSKELLKTQAGLDLHMDAYVLQ